MATPLQQDREMKCKSCMGLAYYDRHLEQRAKAPRCIGFSQSDQGDVDTTDSRQLPGATREFKYYCLGYSSHLAVPNPSRPGQTVEMPYCEGIEVVVTEEHQVAGAQAEALQDQGTFASASEQGAMPAYSRDASSDAASNAGPPSSSSPSPGAHPPGSNNDDDRTRDLRSRFAERWQRNASALRAAVSGERTLPMPMPVQLRSFESMADLQRQFGATLSGNFDKMQFAAGLVGRLVVERTLDAFKPLVERFSSPGEEEPSS